MKIYIHIPFCIKKCNYCDFASYVGGESFFGANKEGESVTYGGCESGIDREGESTFDAYYNALCSQILHKSKNCSEENITSIYFGGGTPTLFGVRRILGVLELVYSNYNVEKEAEITVEGNPKTFDKRMLVELRKGGVNRFSVGIQSFDDDELKSLGRVHSATEGEVALTILSEVFDNFSLDLMLGIPLQTRDSLLSSLQNALSFKPKHISAYLLGVEEGTKFFEMRERGELLLPNEDEVGELYELTNSVLKEGGYERYETSNFAMEGYHSRHNLGYWKLEDYLGFGLSAHSLIGNRRYFSTSSMNEYIANPHKELEEGILTEREKKEEFIMLGLRLKSGIDLVEYERMFGSDFLKEYEKEIEGSIQYLDISKGGVGIKEEFFLFANSIIIKFI